MAKIEMSKEAQSVSEIQVLRDSVEGGITHRNINEYRTTYIINMQDSLDDIYSMLIPFNILSKMTNMISVKVSFWILPYKAYCSNAGDGTFGIYEEDNSPSVKFSISKDNGITYGDVVGTYSENKLNIEITSWVDIIGQKLLKFESTARTRLSVQVEITLDVSR